MTQIEGNVPPHAPPGHADIGERSGAKTTTPLSAVVNIRAVFGESPPRAADRESLVTPAKMGTHLPASCVRTETYRVEQSGSGSESGVSGQSPICKRTESFCRLVIPLQQGAVERRGVSSIAEAGSHRGSDDDLARATRYEVLRPGAGRKRGLLPPSA